MKEKEASIFVESERGLLKPHQPLLTPHTAEPWHRRAKLRRRTF